MSLPYVGKSEYCYSNSLHMVLSAQSASGWAVPPPGRIECLTTMPFGVFYLDRPKRSMFLFDPGARVNPDTGLNVALSALGWRCEEFVGSSRTIPAQALRRLRSALRRGPALVGPMDLGGLTHNPRARYLRGGDHFVVAYRMDGKGVSFQDPFGFPHAWLPVPAFLRAWKTGGEGYRRGPYTLRWAFRPIRPSDPKEAIERTLPQLLPCLTEDPGGPVAFGSLGALDRLRERARRGLPADLRETLVYFSLPLGARRRSDAAEFATDAARPALARIFQEQSELLGRAQFPAVHHRDREFSEYVVRFRELEAEAIRAASSPP